MLTDYEALSRTVQGKSITGRGNEIQVEGARLGQTVGPKEMGRLLYESGLIDYETLTTSEDFREGVSSQKLFHKYAKDQLRDNSPLVVRRAKSITEILPKETLDVFIQYTPEQMADFCYSHPEVAPLYVNEEGRNRWAGTEPLSEKTPFTTIFYLENLDDIADYIERHTARLEGADGLKEQEQFLLLLAYTTPDFAKRLENVLEDGKRLPGYHPDYTYEDYQKDPHQDGRLHTQGALEERVTANIRGWQQANQVMKWAYQSGHEQAYDALWKLDRKSMVTEAKGKLFGEGTTPVYGGIFQIMQANGYYYQNPGITAHTEPTITKEQRETLRELSTPDLFSILTKSGNLIPDHIWNCYAPCMGEGGPLDFSKPQNKDRFLDAMDREIVNFGSRAVAAVKVHQLREQGLLNVKPMLVEITEDLKMSRLLIQDAATKRTIQTLSPDEMRTVLAQEGIIPDMCDYVTGRTDVKGKWTISLPTHQKGDLDITTASGQYYPVETKRKLSHLHSLTVDASWADKLLSEVVEEQRVDLSTYREMSTKALYETFCRIDGKVLLETAQAGDFDFEEAIHDLSEGAAPPAK